jgi:hypothetical protein
MNVQRIMAFRESSRLEPYVDLTRSHPVELIAFALCAANAVYLAASLLYGTWLIDPGGRPIPTDFVNVWAAGHLALEGRPAEAYDWAIHKQVEDAVIGYSFEGYYAWLYPPAFLLVASLLATLPLIAAQGVWLLLTFPPYVAVIRSIVGHRIGVMLACAFPAVVSTFVAGQNGFFTAALIGATLRLLQCQPLAAGICLGLLTYKPQFGLLFPLVLAAGGYWRVIWSATATALLLNAAALAVLGADAWMAFVHSLPLASQAILTEGQADWSKLQSLFGLTRSLGGAEALAWSIQGAALAVTAGLLCVMWRSPLAFDLKAAALAAGALLSTPYLYLYDLVTLAVPMAFLVRASLREGGLPRSALVAFAAVALLILLYPFLKMPVGPFAILIVLGVVAARALRTSAATSRIEGRAAPA